MVKRLDEKGSEHVGWLLWVANRHWQREFAEGVRARGHDWFTEARAGILGMIAPRGTAQADLTEKLALSKQAVQQLVDGLVSEGLCERRIDPDDARGRIVCLTAKGAAAAADWEEVKLAIEQRWARSIGAKQLSALKAILKSVRTDA